VNYLFKRLRWLKWLCRPRHQLILRETCSVDAQKPSLISTLCIMTDAKDRRELCEPSYTGYGPSACSFEVICIINNLYSYQYNLFFLCIWMFLSELFHKGFFFKEAILCPLFRICLCEAHPPEKHNVLWLVGWISVLWFCRPLWACFGNVTLLAIITTSFNTLLTQLNHPFILHVPWAGII